VRPAFRPVSGEDKYLDIAVPLKVGTGFMERFTQ
jgi:hypothetical protein